MTKNSWSLLLFVFLASQYVSGQKMPSDYFDEGEKYVETSDYKNAIAAFQYIVAHHPKNTLFPKAYYNTGYCYFMNNQPDSAALVFKSILIGQFNEKESSGGGLMDDPYTNYRHRASELLSEIYYKKNMYDTALYYLALSDTAYPYLHFCGNGYASNDIRTALRYSDIYQKLNQPDKAIASLLPTVFTKLADNSEVMEELKKLLSGKKHLKKELDNSLNNMYSRTTDDSSARYYFTFLHTEIAVPEPGSYRYTKKEFDKEETIQEIKKSAFYQMIEKL